MDRNEFKIKMNIQQEWKQQVDGWWLEEPEMDVAAMARVMVDNGARLITITARPVEPDLHRLIYHWDIEGTVLNLVLLTRNSSLPSIAAICPAADWIEREIHDYFLIIFTGREDLLPLLLTADSPPGLFQWNKHEGGKK